MKGDIKVDISFWRMATLASVWACWAGSLVFSPQCSGSSNPTKTVSECDAIFLELVKYKMFYELSPESRNILGLDIDGYSYRGWSEMQNKARGLPLNQQCRLAVMVFMALPLDGEFSNRFSVLFGKHRDDVAKSLSKMTKSEIESMANVSARDNNAKDEAMRSFMRKVKSWKTPMTDDEINTFD